MRKVIFLIKQYSVKLGLPGWRQANQLYKKIKRLYRNAQKSKRSFQRSKRRKEMKEKEMKSAYKRYVAECSKLLERSKNTLAETKEWSIKCIAIACEIKRYINHGVRQIDQIIRRVINGEKIPHEEKVFSLFEQHTEWISKGKAGIPQELGLNVCIVEDQYKFILHHKVMEKIVDKDIAVPITEETLVRYPDIESMSFDKGFWSPQNKIKLEQLLDKVILPKKGKLTSEERKTESSEEYSYYRRKHASVESGINALENHGLDRCLDHGINGFKRYVALAVVARNLHNLGDMIQRKEIEKRKKQEKLKLLRSA